MYASLPKLVTLTRTSIQSSLSVKCLTTRVHQHSLQAWPCIHRHYATLSKGDQVAHTHTGKKNSKKDESSQVEIDGSDSEAREVAEGKTFTGVTASLRLDNVVAIGLGTPRGKTEVLVTAGKVKVNGVAVRKRSHQVKLGDVIEVVRVEAVTKRGGVLKLEELALTAKGRHRITFTRLPSSK